MQQIHPDDVIWRNARLATLVAGEPEPYGLKEQHALVVRGQTILAVIPESEVPSGHRQCVDLNGRLVTPGLIDCHTHLVFGGDRAAEWEQRLNGVSYQTISAQGGGINATVTATRNSSPENLLALAQQRLRRLMNEGVTTVEIKSGYGLNADTEEKMLLVTRQLGLNNLVDISPTLLAAHAVPAEYRQDPDAYMTLVCEEIVPALWQKELFEAVDVFCENVGFTPAQTERLFRAAAALGIPVKGHVEQLSSQGGAALVSRYRGFPRIILSILMMRGSRRWRTAARSPYYSRGRSTFFRSVSVPGGAAQKTGRADGRSHRLQSGHQPVCQPASGDEYGLRPVWPDAGRSLGRRDAPCRAGAGARRDARAVEGGLRGRLCRLGGQTSG